MYQVILRKLEENFQRLDLGKETALTLQWL